MHSAAHHALSALAADPEISASARNRLMRYLQSDIYGENDQGVVEVGNSIMQMVHRLFLWPDRNN